MRILPKLLFAGEKPGNPDQQLRWQQHRADERYDLDRFQPSPRWLHRRHDALELSAGDREARQDWKASPY